MARNARIFRDASNFAATTNKRNTTVDAQWGFQQSKGWQVAVDVFNLANVKWNDIEYYYATQLAGEAAPVNDKVIHPGEPRTVRLTLRVGF